MLHYVQPGAFREILKMCCVCLPAVTISWADREGFSKTRDAEIEAAFEEQDEDGDDELQTMEVRKALQTLGFAINFDVLQEFAAQLDLDGSGSFDVTEFKKLVRKAPRPFGIH